MTAPNVLQWQTGLQGRRFAVARVGGKTTVLEITPTEHGSHRVTATVHLGTAAGALMCHGANVLEEMAQAWLDQVDGTPV
jgi:hypothetical protein